MRRLRLALDTIIFLALLGLALPAESAPKVAMIEVKGMVCSA